MVSYTSKISCYVATTHSKQIPTPKSQLTGVGELEMQFSTTIDRTKTLFEEGRALHLHFDRRDREELSKSIKNAACLRELYAIKLYVTRERELSEDALAQLQEVLKRNPTLESFAIRLDDEEILKIPKELFDTINSSKNLTALSISLASALGEFQLPHLTVLALNGCEQIEKCMESFVKFSPHLTSVNIKGSSWESDKTFTAALDGIATLKELKELKLSCDNPNLLAAAIKGCELSLSHLSVYAFGIIEDPLLEAIEKKMGTVQKLTLQGDFAVSKNRIQSLFSALQELEVLKWRSTGCITKEQLAYYTESVPSLEKKVRSGKVYYKGELERDKMMLEKLTKLRKSPGDKVGDSSIATLAKSAKKLQKLILIDDHTLTDEGLMAIASDLKELRELLVIGRGISDKGILAAVEKLDKLNLFYVWGCTVSKVTAETLAALSKTRPLTTNILPDRIDCWSFEKKDT